MAKFLYIIVTENTITKLFPFLDDRLRPQNNEMLMLSFAEYIPLVKAIFKSRYLVRNFNSDLYQWVIDDYLKTKL